MSRVSLAQRLGRVLVGCGGLVLVGASLAAESPAMKQATPATAAADAAAQHRAIAIERAAIERRFSADQQDCQQRFQVNDCLTLASAERRQAMHGLQQRTLQLDDAKRRQRAAQWLQLQQQRQAELAATAANSASGVASGRQAKTASSAASSAAPAAPAAPRRAIRPALQPAIAPDELRAQEQGRRAQYDSRQAVAKTHQQALAERNAEPLRKRPPAAALPVPAASTTLP